MTECEVKPMEGLLSDLLTGKNELESLNGKI